MVDGGWWMVDTVAEARQIVLNVCHHGQDLTFDSTLLQARAGTFLFSRRSRLWLKRKVDSVINQLGRDDKHFNTISHSTIEHPPSNIKKGSTFVKPPTIAYSDINVQY